MEEPLDFVYDIPCSSVAVDSILRLGTAGAIWGSCIGPYNANNQGLKGVARASYVAKSVGRYGFHCGLFAGMFAFTRCAIRKYRRENDWVNGSVAGALAGAAIAVRTRSLRQVIEMAALLSIFGAAVDYTKLL
ncbi:hypothetical protein RJ641_030536 [Dillenia turbinata]|uniref:Mitochondrial import inner membrane translocase subunit TIM22 n=1 Tax=Dillenia turbinata TaxID=194707 RepID=A0AAN8VW30_9MAGN